MRRHILNWLERHRDYFWVLLFPLSLIWAVIAYTRRLQAKRVGPRHFSIPIVSIGNIHSGGSGKTPLVAAFIRRFTEKKGAIISRGYRAKFSGSAIRVDPLQVGAANYFGEEPVWLAEQTGVPVYIASHRSDGLKLALEQSSLDWAILDDGFQHQQVFRDLDLVLINTEKEITSRWCLPWGELREPLSALKHSHAIGLVGGVSSPNLSSWQRLLTEVAPEVPQFSILRKVQGVVTDSKLLKPLGEISVNKYFAFCGIGTPQSFYQDAKANLNLMGFMGFPDHHSYSAKDLNELRQSAKVVSATHLLTTEKDYIKLRELSGALNEIHTLVVSYDVPDALWDFCGKLLQRKCEISGTVGQA